MKKVVGGVEIGLPQVRYGTTVGLLMLSAPIAAGAAIGHIEGDTLDGFINGMLPGMPLTILSECLRYASLLPKRASLRSLSRRGLSLLIASMVILGPASFIVMVVAVCAPSLTDVCRSHTPDDSIALVFGVLALPCAIAGATLLRSDLWARFTVRSRTGPDLSPAISTGGTTSRR